MITVIKTSLDFTREHYSNSNEDCLEWHMLLAWEQWHLK